ncbi:hypothetical protein CVD28_02475 [Bacillus sp. M6-12]|uniref:hypothetical protein n=1 Tax=Bacillus sp. M6-12 TaxID=2054166 RepID=UPI000C75EBD9|nr:hypothetical protein [Bacillus sp. M6-12]PLS19298.1 hypothetical protein CVD28_02475 [Bacillus sp. M6-12]
MKFDVKNVSLYNFLAPWIVSCVFLFTSLYLCILETNFYAYVVPFSLISFVISIFTFYQTHKKVKNEEGSHAIYQFYHISFGVYLLSFIFSMAIVSIYTSIYASGGVFYVWSFLPILLSSLVVLTSAKKGLKKYEMYKQKIV